MVPLIFAASGALIALCAICVVTQPTQLATPIVLIWPLRLALVLLVGFTWGFLLHPPSWLRRALVAFVVPTVLALAFWGGPALAAQMFDGFVSVTIVNFAPYYLAMDGRDQLYATDIDGNFIWVFDSGGNPQGTINPAQAPLVPTPGPGIIPSGYQMETTLPTGILSTPTPIGIPPGVIPGPRFEFCGIAVDSQERLYTLDLQTTNYKLLRFDRQGNITARWPLPSQFEPASGCIAIDQDRIYLNSRKSRVYTIDFEGNPTESIPLDFQPLGISANFHTKGFIAMGGNSLGRYDPTTSKVTTVTLPAEAGAAQIPVFSLLNGDALLSDHISGNVVWLDTKTNKVVRTIGEPGKMAGQFGDIGGIVEDSKGRIYVADYRQRVIQRFTSEGKIDAIWWATRGSLEAEGEQD
jgi:DNA-binding beta-propeller fold protein YncE